MADEQTTALHRCDSGVWLSKDHVTAGWVWRPSCNSSALQAGRGSQSKLASKSSHVNTFWVQLRDPALMIKDESDSGGLECQPHTHMCVCLSTHMRTHTFKHTCTHIPAPTHIQAHEEKNSRAVARTCYRFSSNPGEDLAYHFLVHLFAHYRPPIFKSYLPYGE